MAKPALEEFLQDTAALGSAQAYEFNIRAARTELSESFLTNLIPHLNAMRSEYSRTHPNLLFFPDEIREISIYTKSFDSVLNKIYRQNVLYNRAYPRPQAGGFIDEAGIYTKIDDLIRSRIVCKYMDGPKFVAEKLVEFASTQGIQFRHHAMGTAAGYYAWHCYFRIPASRSVGGVIIEDYVWFELQVTTQLAELMYVLTHQLYERRRLQERGAGGSEENWAWDPRTQEFRSTFLGHGLHLMEGIIQTLKDEVTRAPADIEGGENA